MGAHEPSDGPPVLIGRDTLLATIHARLASGGSVALHGPDGIGRTALLNAVAEAARARGEQVLRVRGHAAERHLPYAAVADLLGQLPADDLAGLPGPARAAARALRAGHPLRTGPPALARRLVLPAVLAAVAARGPVLLVVDDAHRLDPDSADLLAFAARRRPPRNLRVVAARRQRTGSHRAARLCPAPVLELGVPPLDAGDLADLLADRGTPARVAGGLHVRSGGNPALALALAAASVPGPPWRPVPLPETAREMLRARLAELSPGVADTLLVAALSSGPQISGLVRAGRADAARDVRRAADAGLVAVDGERIRFTPDAVREVLADDAGPGRRSGVHANLARAALDPAERLRHRALSSGLPDGGLAADLAVAAADATTRGVHRVAADLYRLAADRLVPPTRDPESRPLTTAGQPPADRGPGGHRPEAPASADAAGSAQRAEMLVAAAEVAAVAGDVAAAGRAAEAVLDDPGAGPEQRVRARVVLVDLSGQALADRDEVFAAALHDAGADARLLGPVRLRLAWRSLIAGSAARAALEAAQAAEHAVAAGDRVVEGMALGVRAHAQRLLGADGWAATLDRALALDTPPPGLLHVSPRYVAARFAMFDDRLADARADLLELLAAAGSGRDGEDLVDILRSLAEVAARTGRCGDALRYAGRAVRVAERAGSSPGPAWYTAALAELAGGSLARAAGYARRGARVSEEEQDNLYLRRNLHALAVAGLRSGETRAGVAVLRRLRTLESTSGAADPAIRRWPGDLAIGLAALGVHDEAEGVLAAARVAGGANLAGHLDRATAVLLSAQGRTESAVALAAAAADRFAALGQPIEQGHALLVQAGAERRRRRYAAARLAIGAALALFRAAEAVPWAEQSERALARTAAQPGGPPAEEQLTSTEARIAALVREGASNREIATRLYLSVKTVEATLTRVYRKLGVRSRTQLSSRMAHTTGFPGVGKGFP